MKKYMIVLSHEAGDHRVCTKTRLETRLSALEIPFTIDSAWFFGKHKAVVNILPHDAQKIEDLDGIETVVAM